jgi:hypothetical protein
MTTELGISRSGPGNAAFSNHSSKTDMDVREAIVIKIIPSYISIILLTYTKLYPLFGPRLSLPTPTRRRGSHVSIPPPVKPACMYICIPSITFAIAWIINWSPNPVPTRMDRELRILALRAYGVYATFVLRHSDRKGMRGWSARRNEI